MLKTKAAVLVSGGGTNLQALIEAASEGQTPHVQLALVVSNRAGAYALTRAENAGIPHEFIPNGPCFEEELVSLLSALIRATC